VKPLPYRTAAIALLALLCCACDSKTVVEKPMYAPPLKPGQVLDKNSEYAKTWPGRPALFKLSSTVFLQIPPQYQGFWLQGDKVTRPPTDLSRLPIQSQVGFQFFMPDFSGYTPENYQTEFHEDLVSVLYVRYEGMGAEQPGAPGAYPPNGFANLTRLPRVIEPDNYIEEYGLRCYPSPSDVAFQTCFGKSGTEFISLRRMPPPYESWVKYPLMQARYFTPKYGGIEIVWRAHMKHFPKWAEIDQQIWKFIDDWNIASQLNPTSPSK
jgi:hypothetical protein